MPKKIKMLMPVNPFPTAGTRIGESQQQLRATAESVFDTLRDPLDIEKMVMDDRKWAEAQAQKQMDFQREMSSTTYQRAIADLKKAGLNPALAYFQGGAPSATGAMATTLSHQQATGLQSMQSYTKLISEMLGLIGKMIPSTSKLIKK